MAASLYIAILNVFKLLEDQLYINIDFCVGVFFDLNMYI